MSNSTFNDRFNAWKNGASYWKDIRGIDLYNNSNTKQEDQPAMTHDEMQALNRQVNSIVQYYDNGKDDQFERNVMESKNLDQTLPLLHYVLRSV